MSEVFISYSRRDQEAVRRLAGALRKDGHTVSIDQDIISGGQLWRAKIVGAIGTADVFLVVLSSSAVASDEVRKELDIAVDKKKPIVPAMLERVTVPDRMAYQLAGVHMVDLIATTDVADERLRKAIRSVLTDVAPALPWTTPGLGPFEKALGLHRPTSVTEPTKPAAPEVPPNPEGLSAILPGDWRVEVDSIVTSIYQSVDRYAFSIRDSGEFNAELFAHTPRYAKKYEGTWVAVGEKSVRFDYYPEGVGGKESFSFTFDFIKPRELRGTTDIMAIGRRHTLWRRTF